MTIHLQPETCPGPLDGLGEARLRHVDQVLFRVLPVHLPRHPVHPGRGLRADRPIGRRKAVDVHVVQPRGEPCLPVHSCHLSYTIQRTQRVGPGSVSGTRSCRPCSPWLTPSPPPPPPPLPRRCSTVSQVLRSHPTSHPRSSQAYRLSVPWAARPVINPDGRAWGLPVLAHGVPYMPWFSDRAGSTSDSRIATSSVAVHRSDSLGTPILGFRGSIARPAGAPVNAAPRPRGASTHD